MKWQQRVRVISGLSCMQILLNLAVIVLLVTGWFTARLVAVSLGFCLFYALMFLLMFVFQRQDNNKLREAGDFLEELTTSWYSGAALIALWLLSRVLHHNLLLALIGFAMLAGPALVSLLVKERKSGSGDFPPEQDERR